MNKNNQNQDSKLAVYELAVLVDPKLSETAIGKKIDQLGAIVAQESGSVISRGEVAMRDLAYEITLKHEGKRRDFTKAYFNWIKFEQLPESIGEIESALKADNDLVRFLVIKTTREDHVTSLTDEFSPEDTDGDDEEAEDDETAESDGSTEDTDGDDVAEGDE